MKIIFQTLLFSIISFCSYAQYSFEIEVEYAQQVGNTDRYSISGKLLKGKVENNKKYYLSNGAELNVDNVMSAASGTSAPVVVAPDKVSISAKCSNYKPEQKTIIYGISTQPNYGGQVVRNDYYEKVPEGILKIKLNGMMFTAKQISKPIRTKSADVLDMYFKTNSNAIFWLRIGNLHKIEAMPFDLPSDSLLWGGAEPYCRITFLPDGFLPTDLPNNYKGYEDKKGNAHIVLTRLKKYSQEATFEISGMLKPNHKILEENENAQPISISEGRVDKVIWDDH